MLFGSKTRILPYEESSTEKETTDDSKHPRVRPNWREAEMHLITDNYVFSLM